MKRLTVLVSVLLFCVFSIYAESRLHVAEEAEPGTVLTVYLEGFEPEASVTVTFADGRIISATGFMMPEDTDPPVEVAFLGIPCNVQPGPATLILQGISDGTAVREERSVAVVERIFKTETIPLTEALTRLREEEKEARALEAQKLYRILITFSPESIYDPGPYGEPVQGARISSWFGDRRTYTSPDGGRSRSIHSGIDLAAPEGTAVFSSGAGRVAFSGRRIITGETIVVEHMPCVYCLYYHCRDRFVKAGEEVYKGQVIGTIGTTGLATGPHLHWEFRVGGVPVDPQPLVRKGLLDQGERT